MGKGAIIGIIIGIIAMIFLVIYWFFIRVKETVVSIADPNVSDPNVGVVLQDGAVPGDQGVYVSSNGGLPEAHAPGAEDRSVTPGPTVPSTAQLDPSADWLPGGDERTLIYPNADLAVTRPDIGYVDTGAPEVERKPPTGTTVSPDNSFTLSEGYGKAHPTDERLSMGTVLMGSNAKPPSILEL